jgi:glycosyltransferase involved in cell wall biosynthesis
MLRDMMYPLADGFVFQTAEAQRYFSKKIQKRSTIIANPIKANLPEPFEGERTDRVVALGRLEPQKNYPLLFRAFKRVAEKRDGLTLDIYGGGSQQENLAKLIAEMGMENKIFLRGISANVHDEVLDASAFVLSSDFEGMPNALMEAMAIGLPCISTDCPCGGPEFLIDNEVNGLLVPVKDEEALVNALERVLSDKNFSQRISENAVKLREECNLERIADKWLEFIEK